MRTIFSFLILILSLIPLSVRTSHERNIHFSEFEKSTELLTVFFVLDGVEVELSTPFLPNPNIILPEPGDSLQAANSILREPLFQSLTITTFPIGTKPGTETFPRLESNKIDIYKEILIEHRKSQGGTPQDGPAIKIFDQQVLGIMSTIWLYIDVFEPKPVQIIEWLAEAGDRIWLVRVGQEISNRDAKESILSQNHPIKEIHGLELSSTNTDVPSTSFHTDSILIKFPQKNVATSLNNLPFPPWWDGDCDINNYTIPTGESAFPLGGIYRDLKACGPRPWVVGGNHYLVRFYSGAWGEYEWECVELSMRFLYLTYGIEPYQANGNQVVTNYSGDRLEKINNCTHGKAPQPNDIISSGPISPWGHTTVVMTSDVDANGNGIITALEQNSSVNGIRTYQVSNWVVLSTDTVIGWLHDPQQDIVTYYFPLISR